MTRSLLTVLVALTLAVPAMALRPYKRKYKYYLSADHAEEIIAGIPIKPQLLNYEWANIVGSLKGQKYTIRRGDNLWNISRRDFGNARLWRKLWEVNPYLTNPHELTIGQLLDYYREGGPEAKQIPLIKLIPGDRHAYDLDSDEMYQKNLRNRFRPPIVVLDEKDVLGELTGSYSEGEWVRELDELYANFLVKAKVNKGDRFSVVRYDRLLVDRTDPGKPVLGTLWKLVGDIEVIGFGGSLARVRLTGQRGTVQRGDTIVPYQLPVEIGEYFYPPEKIHARVIAGEHSERNIFGQNEIILVNRGRKDGIRDGVLLRAYRDADPRTGKRGGVEPQAEGDVQIIVTGERASVGVIKRTLLPIAIGDTLLPTQAFPEGEPPIERPSLTLEIE